MRQLVIDRIRGSQKWQSCIDNGMEADMPILEVQSDTDLLAIYEFYCV